MDAPLMYSSQLAIWHLTDGETPVDVDHTLADKIIEYAKSGAEPFDVSTSITSLPEAIKAGTVSAVLKNYVDIADDPSPVYEYFGQVNLVLTNLTNQE